MLDPAVYTEEDILTELGLKGKVKSLKELAALAAEAEKLKAESGKYKSNFESLARAAQGAKFKDFQEVLDAAIKGRSGQSAAPLKGGGNGNPDLAEKLRAQHEKFYGPENHKAALSADPRMFEFLASVLASNAPAEVDFSERDNAMASLQDKQQWFEFVDSLEGDERKQAKQLYGHLDKIFRDDELFKKPADADETYNGYGEARKRYLDGLRKAGILKEDETKKIETSPTRRIAFAGSGQSAAPLKGGPARYDRIIQENSEVLNPESGEIDDEKFSPQPGV